VLLPLKIVRPLREHFRHKKKEHKDRARPLLKVVGLNGFEQKYPWQLSDGMRHRASLCRALIHEPCLLLLDELFSALDAFTCEELWGILQYLWLKNIVMITHDLREAVYLSDKGYVMSARPGRILYERDITFELPRHLDITFDDTFVQVAQNLLQNIQLGRDEAAAVVNSRVADPWPRQNPPGRRTWVGTAVDCFWKVTCVAPYFSTIALFAVREIGCVIFDIK